MRRQRDSLSADETFVPGPALLALFADDDASAVADHGGDVARVAKQGARRVDRRAAAGGGVNAAAPPSRWLAQQDMPAPVSSARRAQMDEAGVVSAKAEALRPEDIAASAEACHYHYYMHALQPNQRSMAT